MTEDQLVKIAAKAIFNELFFGFVSPSKDAAEIAVKTARPILAAIRPHIEAIERERCAAELDKIAEGLRKCAASTRNEWCGPDVPKEDRLANYADAARDETNAAAYQRAAAAIRAESKEENP